MLLAITALYYAIALLGSRQLVAHPETKPSHRVILWVLLVLVPVLNLPVFFTGLETVLGWLGRGIVMLMGAIEIVKLALIFAQLWVLDKIYSLRVNK